MKRKNKNPNQINLFDLFQSSERSINTTKNVGKSKKEEKHCASTQIDLFNLPDQSMKDTKSIINTITTEIKKTTNNITCKVKKSIKEISNYKITENDKLDKEYFNSSKKSETNIKAIKLLKEIEDEKRSITLDEKKVLVQYSGWGGIPKIFKEKFEDPFDECSAKELRNILNDREYKEAKESCINAHYTSPTVIKAIWELSQRLGFDGGKILEPSCGTGLFFGLIPNNTLEDSELYGIELDSITSRIANMLYPDADILNIGFQQSDKYIEDKSMDIAIGNVPFGNFSILSDPKFSKYKFSIHNYFFAKSLDKLRNGGLLIFITSKFTMDSQDTKIREYIKEKADFIGAIRLPNNAFKKMAGTEVVTDIIVLKKKEENISYKSESFINLLSNDDGMTVNEYFINHPEMIIGEETIKESNMYGTKEYTVILNKTDNIEDKLKEAIKLFPKDIYADNRTYEETISTKDTIDACIYPHLKEGNYIVISNKLYQKHLSQLLLCKASKNKVSKLEKIINIRDLIHEILEDQISNKSDEAINLKQSILSSLYDEFILHYGYLSDNKKDYKEDPDCELISNLEIKNNDTGNLDKAAIFTERTIMPYKKVTNCDTAQDSLIISLNEYGFINLGRMMELTNKSEEELVLELKGKIYKNPETTKYETANQYLSGNVREKLKLAIEYAETNEEYFDNIVSLKAVQPKDLDAEDIKVKLGTPWIPCKDIKDFIINLLDIQDYYKDKLIVNYIPYLGTWILDSQKVYINDSKNTQEYGTSRIKAIRIIEQSINMQQPSIYDEWDDSEGHHRVLNKKETLFARTQQDKIKQEFESWIWNNPQRRTRLCKIYNEKFNSFREEVYDGSNLQLHNVNPNINLRSHQKNAIYRGLYSNKCILLAHCVGSGKTFVQQAIAMESKYLGICHKPMFVIPNNLVESGQFAKEFLQLYPNANILTSTSKDFEKKRRRKLFAKIAVGNWDAVIIGHSSFGKIPVSKELQQDFINEEISLLDQSILLGNDDKENNTKMIKQLEKQKKSLEEKLEKMLDENKRDNLLNFEELGIDMLVVDESHQFKNLFVCSKMQNISGISHTSAMKTEDMFMKVKYIQKINGGKKGVVFASGTPVSNSVCEMYTLQRYLQPYRLKELELESFDAWAGLFGEVVTSIEVSPTGQGYRSKQRFARFYNVPELMSIFKEVSDIITPDMITLDIPELENKKPIINTIEIHEDVKEYISTLVKRAEDIHNGKVTPKEDNMLKVTNDGRKAALDSRLVDINVDYSESKVNTAIKNIYNEWQNGISKKTTQLVFCDIGTPKKQKSTINSLESPNNCFNVYSEIKNKLLNLGIPEKEIAFIHDGNTSIKRTSIIEKVKNGDIRILIGSTSKMGEGTNFQQRIVAIHELDCPWRPADIVQREGRGLRQGNLHFEWKLPIRIYRYAAKGTFDAYNWQIIKTKAKFIDQIMNGKAETREIEDIDDRAMSYAEIKAVSSDNPLILEKFKIDSEIVKLQILKSSYKKQHYQLEFKIAESEENISKSKNIIQALVEDIKLKNKNATKKLNIKVNNIIYNEKNDTNITGNTVTFSERKDAGEAIFEIVKDMNVQETRVIGEAWGFKIKVIKSNFFESTFSIQLQGDAIYTIKSTFDSPEGTITKIFNALKNLDKNLEETILSLKNEELELESYKRELERPFEKELILKQLLKQQSDINGKLNIGFSELDVDPTLSDTN